MQQRQVENIIDSNSESKYIHHENPGIIQLYSRAIIDRRSERFEISMISNTDNMMHLGFIWVSCVITY